jgi:hypothetical protein
MLTVQRLKTWEDLKDLVSSNIIQESQIDSILMNVLANADSNSLTLTDFVFFVKLLNDAMEANEQQNDVTDDKVVVSSNLEQKNDETSEKVSETSGYSLEETEEDDYLSAYEGLKGDSLVS